MAEPADLAIHTHVEADTRDRDTRLVFSRLGFAILAAGAALVVGVLIWQAMVAGGDPNPTDATLSPTAAVVETGILVFREGLEAILILAAVSASLVRRQPAFGRPIALGAGLATLATIATWFAVVGIISAIDAPALDVQAGTGLLAIVVLLVIMNWFFHKIYWTGWISHHNRRGRQLAVKPSGEPSRALTGLILLGFTAIYREGFEIVLFLQSLRLQVGSAAVLEGAIIGLALTVVVAVLTFAAHQHLPYRKMLVLTGVMLGGVLIVMVGESIQEMQLAGWIGTTGVGLGMPAWLGVWFAVFPNLEGLVAQLGAAAAVLGSYVVAEHWTEWRPRLSAVVTARLPGEVS